MRLYFRTSKGQASWLEMGQGLARDVLWQESSLRITLREGKRLYGKVQLRVQSMHMLVCAESNWIKSFPVPAFRFSISNDLKFDAERDLKDIDAPHIPVLALNKVSPGGIGDRAGKCVYFPLEMFVKVYPVFTCVLTISFCFCRLSMETQLPQKESYLQPILPWSVRVRQGGSTGRELNRSLTGASQTLMVLYPLILTSTCLGFLMQIAFWSLHFCP